VAAGPRGPRFRAVARAAGAAGPLRCEALLWPEAAGARPEAPQGEGITACRGALACERCLSVLKRPLHNYYSTRYNGKLPI